VNNMFRLFSRVLLFIANWIFENDIQNNQQPEKIKLSYDVLKQLIEEIRFDRHRLSKYSMHMLNNGWKTWDRKSYVFVKHNIRIEFRKDEQYVILTIGGEDITVYRHECDDYIKGAWLGVVIPDLQLAIEGVRNDDIECEADNKQIDVLQRTLVARQNFKDVYFTEDEYVQ